MFRNIIVLCIIFIGLFLILRYTGTYKENFDDVTLPDPYCASVEKNKTQTSNLSNLINLTNSPIDLNTSLLDEAVRTIDATPTASGHSLKPVVIEKSVKNIPTAIATGKSCEAAPRTCDAFNDPIFAANCGMSFDINGTKTDGSQHMGGLYITSQSRDIQNDEFDTSMQTGKPYIDPYHSFQPTLGTAARGTFGITKNGCTVVKEKVDCKAKQMFSSPNCTMCYTSGDFSRVGPETGRLPATLYLSGNGKVSIGNSKGSISMKQTALSNDPIKFELPADGEGSAFNISVIGDIPINIAGYIQGTTARGTFTLDLNTIVENDRITNRKPRISGTTSISGIRCVIIIPGSGKTSIDLACLIPFSFLNMYDSDAWTCDNGPIITKESSAIFLESDPCFNRANKPGAYKIECLQSRWLQLGGTESGTGYPKDKASADALQIDASGNPLSINSIVDMLSAKINAALSGKDSYGNDLSISTWNDVSMYMVGVSILTPCDGPGGIGPSQRCKDYLFRNNGSGGRIGGTYTLDKRFNNTEGFDVNKFAPSENVPTPPASGSIPVIKTEFDDAARSAFDNKKTNKARQKDIKKILDVDILNPTAGVIEFEKYTPAGKPAETHEQLKDFCAASGKRLCNSDELCNMQTRILKYPGLNTDFLTDKGVNYAKDNWIAVGDKNNEWLTLLNKDGRFCKTHTEVANVLPNWGQSTNPRGFETLAMCCGGDPSSMVGQIIRLQFDHYECLNLAQMKVYSSKDGENIIKSNMKATQSDEWPHGGSYPAKNLIDGVGNSLAHTSCGSIPWLEVDLGLAAPIQRIVITNRKDCCKERILGTTLIIMTGSRKIIYNSRRITAIHDTYTYFPPYTTVYGDYTGNNRPVDKKGKYSGYKHLGCWGDTGNRAIPPMDGSDAGVSGNYQERKKAIKRCYDIAQQKGLKYFGVQHGGWCAAGNDLNSAKKYGKSNQCWPGGKGGPWANDVYEVGDDDNTTNMPRVTLHGNNGSTSCERYCSGVNGGSWDGAMPQDWDGASCVGVDPRIKDCYSTFPDAGGAGCSCVKTGSGWRQGGFLHN